VGQTQTAETTATATAASAATFCYTLQTVREVDHAEFSCFSALLQARHHNQTDVAARTAAKAETKVALGVAARGALPPQLPPSKPSHGSSPADITPH